MFLRRSKFLFWLNQKIKGKIQAVNMANEKFYLNEKQLFCLKNKTHCNDNDAKEVCLADIYSNHQILYYNDEKSKNCKKSNRNNNFDIDNLDDYSFNELEIGKKINKKKFETYQKISNFSFYSQLKSDRISIEIDSFEWRK